MRDEEINFILIDEPETSLNTAWQEEFLPLLSEYNDGAQIIVASHSPAIVSNPSFLSELK